MRAIKAKLILGNKTLTLKPVFEKYAELTKKEFEKTTETWHDTDPTFEHEIDGEESVHIGPADDDDGKIWTYLEEGTDVRRAVMTPDFEPKTTPGVVGSSPGAGGLAFVNPDLELPGIEARGWSEIIAEKLEPRFVTDVQKMIDRTLRTF